MLKINKLCLNYSPLKKDFRYRISDVPNPVFSWAAVSDRNGAYQSAYRIAVKSGGELLWDSGTVGNRKQSAVYEGKPIPVGRKLTVSVTVWDDSGEVSADYADYFYGGALAVWDADWIAHPDDADGVKRSVRKNLVFSKHIDVSENLESACLFVCGLGYHKVRINGANADVSELDPLHSDYTKTIYYAVLPEVADLLRQGSNEIEVSVASGWRDIDSAIIDRFRGDGVGFCGIKQMSAILTLKYKNGEERKIYTDSDWKVCVDNSSESNIYDGETFDLTKSRGEYRDAAVVAAPCRNMRAQSLQPIRPGKEYAAKSIYSPVKGIWVADFGQNIAGVAKLKLPSDLKKGDKVTIKFAEVKKDDGTVNQDPLREAKCADTYISDGNESGCTAWQPSFTYHGFRYAQVEGLDILDKRDITAVSLYTDLDSESVFECGDALVNKIHKNAVMTERANMHGILTDCPQRDERMGWMNDATVRFEGTPYNFDIGRMFPKIARDIMDAQSEDGAITCTAPYVFGSRPADPVCSSFLIAGYEALMRTGNIEIIREAYDSFRAWEDFLLSRSDGYIVGYSYYGDWASPAYACDRPEGAASAVTPGILMSTGYSYLNSKLISKFANMLGYDADVEKYAGIGEKIKAAFLAKWFDEKTCVVAEGSQASHAFALWLGLIPEEYEQKTADLMKNSLVNNGYRITTGNLCTRYLFDMLTKYGYVDTAWELITRQEYPSYGYMIQNEATTIWERFELKLEPGMNSHNHPMYGAVDYWFYAYLAGVKPVSPAFDEFTVEPHYPEKLLSLNAVIDTVKGDIEVRWIKQYCKLWLYATVPFGTTANIKAGGKYVKVGSGFHRLLIGDANIRN